MPTTTHFDPNFSVLALQTRTDAAGVDVTDVDGPELRLPWSMYTEGVRSADDYEVTATGANMSVDVGSGTAFNDLAVVAGDTAGQGNYGVLLEASTVNLTVPAADLSNPRIDQVYLAVVDDPGTMVKARLAYRAGDAAASPSAPGPDSSWDGYLLLGTVAVGAGATAITGGDLTDARVQSASRVPAVSGVLTGGTTAISNGTLTTTLTTVGSTSFTMPAGWSGAHILAWGSVAVVPSSAGTVRIVIGSSNGTARPQPFNAGNQMVDAAARHEDDVTDDVTIAIQARSGGSGETWRNPVISFIAYRTS